MDRPVSSLWKGEQRPSGARNKAMLKGPAVGCSYPPVLNCVLLQISRFVFSIFS